MSFSFLPLLSHPVTHINRLALSSSVRPIRGQKNRMDDKKLLRRHEHRDAFVVVAERGTRAVSHSRVMRRAGASSLGSDIALKSLKAFTFYAHISQLAIAFRVAVLMTIIASRSRLASTMRHDKPGQEAGARLTIWYPQSNCRRFVCNIGTRFHGLPPSILTLTHNSSLHHNHFLHRSLPPPPFPFGPPALHAPLPLLLMRHTHAAHRIGVSLLYVSTPLDPSPRAATKDRRPGLLGVHTFTILACSSISTIPTCSVSQRSYTDPVGQQTLVPLHPPVTSSRRIRAGMVIGRPNDHASTSSVERTVLLPPEDWTTLWRKLVLRLFDGAPSRSFTAGHRTDLSRWHPIPRPPSLSTN